MRGHHASIEEVKHRAERISKDARWWIIPLARFGYAAKGAVYMIVGVLAVVAAFGSRGEQTADSHGALEKILDQPFGQILLGATAVGLAGYAIWRFVQAIMDTENKGADVKGIGTRIGYAGIGVIYAGLAYSAAQLIIGSRGSRSGGGDNASQEWTARLLSQPFGPWLVGIVGAGIIAFAIFQFYKAYTTKFLETLETGRMSNSTERWTKRIGRIGLVARGIVFAIIGVFLIQAALQFDPDQARGLSGALRALEQQPYGPWLLGLVALGLVVYGIYMLILAWYRRIII